MAAMGTDIIKGANFVILSTSDKNILLMNFGGEIRALFSNLADMASIVPRLIKDRLFLHVINFGAYIKPRRHGVRNRRISGKWRITILPFQQIC